MLVLLVSFVAAFFGGVGDAGGHHQAQAAVKGHGPCGIGIVAGSPGPPWACTSGVANTRARANRSAKRDLLFIFVIIRRV
ncbi:hypothetical protein GCM10023229_29200 [Flavisolibacter ginsenosidimutans]